ncbi:MAG TPA: alanine--tRNA ligase, partial [Opitutaceae bacterium]|nr:alanine--tRNA ligase [Opitutaceae bacterium]
LTWGWELLTKVWGIPPKRLFATVYSPDKAKGDPSEFDQEAHDIWAGIFQKAGLDPAIHIVNGSKKDNFWMMGDTGPCGPCSEIHFNLLPNDDEAAGRKLVNAGSPRCIEIWNHVFIQFNANADGTFSPLAARHVDTGMGFERVAGIYATTKGFTDFSPEPSNYAADVFAPLLKKIAEISGKRYQGTVPTKREGLTEQENIDVAFRVLADHARCVACAIADGILPGNEGRNYVVRRILRRGILYGTKLQLETGFFEQLVAPVIESLGPVFPELKEQRDLIRRVVHSEEESFGRTLDRGLVFFRKNIIDLASKSAAEILPNEDPAYYSVLAMALLLNLEKAAHAHDSELADPESAQKHLDQLRQSFKIPGSLAFVLYDTYGFPLDMTQLIAAESGLTIDTAEVDRLMDQQRERARAAQKKEVVVAATADDATRDLKPTDFVGYTLNPGEGVHAKLLSFENEFLIFDKTPFYAEMGGQIGDSGHALIKGTPFVITNTIKDKFGRYLHKVAIPSPTNLPKIATTATLTVDLARRRAISRHHTATHLLNWALRKVLGTHVRQAGSLNAPDHLRFDFSHFEAVTQEQLREIERLVNEKVIDNARVEAYETDFDKKPADTLAFFGEKYGKVVRVVDIGGYSRELCGGTHVATTGEIGLVKIVHESAIAAGTRRIDAVAGQAAYDFIAEHEAALDAISVHLSAGPQDVVKKVESLLAHQKELEKKLKAFEQRTAAGLADELATMATVRDDGLKLVSAGVTADSPEALRSLGAQILAKLGEGAVLLGATFGDKATIVTFCSPAAIKAGLHAGNLVYQLSQKLGGKGGGKPDFAMGGGKDTSKLAEVLKSVWEN